MASEQSIVSELSFGEVISRTFELYQRNFVKYFVLFLVVEAIIGVVDTLAYNAFPLPTLPPNPTTQQVLDWAPGFFGALASLLLVIVGVVLIFGPIATGGTVKMASEEVEGKPVDLWASVRFAASKLVWMWALGLLVGIVVFLGLVALVVPGIILAIMFCLTLPALLIENAGVVGSLGRSRELVGHRWLKTFAIFLVLIIIVGVASAIVSAISGLFGAADRLVSNLLSAFYQPILPIAATVYFYSNRARVAPVQVGASVEPAVMPQLGMKFCPNCGTQLASSAGFCSKCGAKQPS